MFDLLEQAKMVAKSNVSVLILGESGTGKELLAQAIHGASERNTRSFVPINCGAIPPDLLESELFGYRKGAFTGANQDFKGLFLTAHQGTLFLDEIGDMPLALQVKLLRVLQDSKVRQLGATEHQDINVRVIAATHRDLQQAIVDGDFREDLYYRLNVVSLEIPPLRSRREDIPLLVNHFLKRHAEQHHQLVKHFSNEAMQLVMQYHWPGNIRQLQNMVEKMIALCPGQVISESLVQAGLPRDRLKITPLTEAKQQFEKNYVKQLLKMTGGNIPEAAALAQRNRSDFYKIMRRHNIDNELYRIKDATELTNE
jgi:two-component system response regulator GlrR